MYCALLFITTLQQENAESLRNTRDSDLDSKVAERRSQRKVARNAISSIDVGNEKFLGSKSRKDGQSVKVRIDRKIGEGVGGGVEEGIGERIGEGICGRLGDRVGEEVGGKVDGECA